MEGRKERRKRERKEEERERKREAGVTCLHPSLFEGKALKLIYSNKNFI